MSSGARISDLIAGDLQQRIDTGQALPCALTIAALAKHYQVSQSPVRTAVEQLVARQFLQKLGNGRLRINADKLGKQQAGSSPVIPPIRLEEDRTRVMDQLVQHVVLLSLAGEEQFLREEATADQFAIGRAFTRQIFSELAGRELLEHVPRRGWRVLPFSLTDMLQYLEIREVLECKALRLAAGKLERQRLQEMLDANPDPQHYDFSAAGFQLNNEIHGYLIQKSNNRYITAFFQRNGLYFSKLFDLAAFGQAAHRVISQQHRWILQACLDQQWDEAERQLANHIRDQQAVVSDLLDRFRKNPVECSRQFDDGNS